MTIDRGERRPLLLTLGKELRVARERHGMTQQELARRLHFSDSQISAVETGKRTPHEALVMRADDLLNTGGLLTRLLEAAHESAGPEPAQFPVRPWHSIEETATAVRSYQPLVIDPLLQTADYATALAYATSGMADTDAIQAGTDALLQRQQILARDDAPQLVVILEEAVLRRPIGGGDVMRQQLEHLVRIGASPRTAVHVLSTDVGAHRGSPAPLSSRACPACPTSLSSKPSLAVVSLTIFHRSTLSGAPGKDYSGSRPRDAFR